MADKTKPTWPVARKSATGASSPDASPTWLGIHSATWSRWKQSHLDIDQYIVAALYVLLHDVDGLRHRTCL